MGAPTDKHSPPTDGLPRFDPAEMAIAAPQVVALLSLMDAIALNAAARSAPAEPTTDETYNVCAFFALFFRDMAFSTAEVGGIDAKTFITTLWKNADGTETEVRVQRAIAAFVLLATEVSGVLVSTGHSYAALHQTVADLRQWGARYDS